MTYYTQDTFTRPVLRVACLRALWPEQLENSAGRFWKADRYSGQQNKMGMKQRVAATKPLNTLLSVPQPPPQWLDEPRHQTQRLSQQTFAQQPPTEGDFFMMTRAGGTQDAQASVMISSHWLMSLECATQAFSAESYWLVCLAYKGDSEIQRSRGIASW